MLTEEPRTRFSEDSALSIPAVPKSTSRFTIRLKRKNAPVSEQRLNAKPNVLASVPDKNGVENKNGDIAQEDPTQTLVSDLTTEKRSVSPRPINQPQEEAPPPRTTDRRKPPPLPLHKSESKAKYPPFLRRLTQKLRLPAPPPSSSPGLVNDFTRKELRDAALRERGLLPKDLSEQELERDLMIPVRISQDSDLEKSEAKRIKEEWMAKMKRMNDDESAEKPPDHVTSTLQPEASLPPVPSPKERLLTPVPEVPAELTLSNNSPADSPSPKNGSSSPLTNTPDTPPDWLLPSWLAAFETTDDPSSDVLKTQDSPTRLAVVSEGGDEDGHGDGADGSDLSSPLTSPTEPATPPVIHLQLLDPMTVPLPPSPISPLSSSNGMSARQVVTAKVSMTRSKSTPPPSRPVPDIPCSDIPNVVNSPGLRATRSDEQLPATPPSLTFSPASPSNGSNDTPALTVPSDERPALQLSIPGLDINSIREEVESPLEGSVQEIRGVLPDSDVVEEDECTESQSSHATKEEQSALRVRTEVKKALTDADAYRQQVNKRKSKTLSLFRKTSSVKSPVASEFSEVDLSTKSENRVSVSLSNFTKSVRGSKRTKSTSLPQLHPNSLFDASHLPPSPTLPSMLTSESRGSLSPNDAVRRQGTGVGLRAPISPTIHNRASILMEAGAIGDAESRRLSEMAFLDM